MTARTLVEREPNYSFVTARLLMDTLRAEGLGFLNVADSATHHEMADLYAKALPAYIAKGIEFELLNPALADFDLEKLGKAINHERDQQFTYLGLQTLYDRYFIHKDGVRFELPQVFFMRVAMGLALEEKDKEARAIEFYNLLSSFDYMASTPTLFNAGTLRPQLSSCYLTTVPDDLSGIYHAIHDNAMLSKFAGGLGNDWTCACTRLLHQGHQRQVPGRRTVPESGQRHRRCRQPGWQAQGGRVCLPGNLAPGHRRVHRAAQEHR